MHIQDTNMRSVVPVQVKVAVSISRLATCNSMQNIADLYRIGLSTSQLAVSQFTNAVRLLLLKKYIRWPFTTTMNKFAREFENIHRIPYGWCGGRFTHTNCRTRLHAADYYNRKGFHSILLQGVVSSKCLFWDFDIGWAGSMYDANLWEKTTIGQFCEVGKLTSYALIGNAAYPCRPFRGHKDGLIREEYNWNFVQSSIRMCIERAFGMLKGRWEILLRMIDMYLKNNVHELVSTCLVLYNICIILGDKFWKTKWLQEALDEVHNGLSLVTPPEPTRREKLAVANHVLYNLARIEESSRETLEYIKQEATREFQVSMICNLRMIFKPFKKIHSNNKKLLA
jgi:hypothetical protein